MVWSARLWNVRSHEDLLGQWGALPKYYKTRMCADAGGGGQPGRATGAALLFFCGAPFASPSSLSRPTSRLPPNPRAWGRLPAAVRDLLQCIPGKLLGISFTNRPHLEAVV